MNKAFLEHILNTKAMVRESHPPVFRLINYLKKAEALALKDISDIEHGLEQKKKKCYTRLTSNLNRIVDQYDRKNPQKDSRYC